nr:MAG TPA: hypothetical protein [Caudoviricetes sp.]
MMVKVFPISRRLIKSPKHLCKRIFIRGVYMIRDFIPVPIAAHQRQKIA